MNPQPSPSPAPSSAKPVDILLIEDSRIDRMITLEALRELRIAHRLHTVEDGEAALAFLRRRGEHTNAPRPDLILLDLNLPRKDGREVLQEIKTDPNLHHIPVVVLTTSSSEEDVLEAYASHANCFITKPIDLEHFARVARSLENFWFETATLPPRPGPGFSPPAPSAATSATDKETNPDDAPTHCRLLLVESDPADALILEKALSESKLVRFEVDQVDTLQRALSKLRNTGYAVVVTDLKLPDGEGLELLRRLVRAAGDTPVVVLTHDDDERRGLEFLREGARDCVVKGELGGKALARVIRQAMDRARIETQLRHAQRMESVGLLAGGVAHDFNNLLAIIRGNAELLLAGATEAPTLARQIVDASERGARLTKQLLTFSRRERLRIARVDINLLVREMAELLKRTLGPCVHLHLPPPSGPAPVLADPGLIEQAIMNLCLNARDAMHGEGDLTLSVEVRELTADSPGPRPPAGPGPYVRLSVRDTGPGIPPEILPRVFEPFFTTKQAGRGSGLGLATVHGVARQHRGAVEAKSEPGRGAEFIVWLPLARKDAETPETPRRNPVATDNPCPPQTTPPCILVVEDEPMVREMVTLALRARSYEVLAAESAEAALALWPDQRDRVRLLLTDLLMPGLNGYELARRLLAEKPGLPVIYSSGFHDAVLTRQLRFKPGINFVPKPYSLDELDAVIRRALQS